MGAPSPEQFPGAASRTAPCSPRVDRAELQRREEALTLEAVVRSLDQERLESRERLVAQAEDYIAVREAWIQEEVDRRVAGACSALEREYEAKLMLIKAKDEGR